MAAYPNSTPLSRDTASVATPSPERSEAVDYRDLEAIRRVRAIPASCHPDRPAWVVSETQLCHECEDRRFRAEMFAVGARAAGFPVNDIAALNMVDTVDSLAAKVPMSASDRRAA